MVFSRKPISWINAEKLLTKDVASKESDRVVRGWFGAKVLSEPFAQPDRDRRLAGTYRSANRNNMRDQGASLRH
jgi:hypothetical protein